MIRQDSVNQAYPLSEKMAKRGFRILPRPGSPLAQAVAASVGFSHSEADTLDVIAESMRSYTEGTDLENPALHSITMDEIVGVVSEAIRGHLKYAREVVKPLALEYGEAVSNALLTYEPAEAASQFNIISYEMPALIKDQSFMAPLETYRENQPVQPLRVDVLPPATGEEILDMMLTGDSTIDDSIKAWYTTQEPGLFEGLWAGFFSDKQDNVKNLTYDQIRNMNIFEKAYAGLTLYLLTKKLYNEPPEGTPLTLQDWNDRVASVRDYGAALFMRSLMLYGNLVRNKIMVIHLNPIQKYCMVNAAVYNDWLKDGGSPEVVLGLITSNKDYVTVSNISSHADELLRSWSQYVSMYKTRAVNDRYEAFKGILYSQFVKLMEEVTPQEKEYIDTVDDFSGDVMIRLNHELDYIRISDMETVYDTALRLMCRARFPYTQAERILSYINEALKLNPNIDVREAAFIATLEYTCDYLAAQFIKAR